MTYTADITPQREIILRRVEAQTCPLVSHIDAGPACIRFLNHVGTSQLHQQQAVDVRLNCMPLLSSSEARSLLLMVCVAPYSDVSGIARLG